MAPRPTVRAGLLLLVLALAGLPVAPATDARHAVATAAQPGLAEMLASAPDLYAESALPASFFAQFADSAAQMEAFGIESPNLADPVAYALWARANAWMGFPVPFHLRALDERWRVLLGFDPTAIDRSLQIREPPRSLIILQGRFSGAALRVAWVESGYRALPTEGAEVYSLFPDETIDLNNPIHQLALSSLNNAAFLPDGTLLFASRLDWLMQAIAARRGEAPTLLARPEVGALVAVDPGLVSAYLAHGETLHSPGDAPATPAPDPEATPAGAMPPVALALVGVTAGGPLPAERPVATPVVTASPLAAGRPEARFVVALRFADRAAAAAAPAVIAERLRTGATTATRQPFAALFSDWRITVAPAGAVVSIVLEIAAGTPVELGLTLYLRGDLAFVTWV